MRPRREPGPLESSREVRAAIARLIRAERVATEQAGGAATAIELRPVLSFEAVETLEEHFRAGIHDDALALFASKCGALDGLELGRVGSYTEHAWELGLGKARLALGESGGRLVCIPRRPEKGYALRVTFFDVEDRTEGDSQPISAWIDQLVDTAVAELDPEALERFELEGEDLDWHARLERTLVRVEPGTEASGRRVRHARFGDGVVLREIPGTDKLEIDFGPQGVKVMVSRFVTDA